MKLTKGQRRIMAKAHAKSYVTLDDAWTEYSDHRVAAQTLKRLVMLGFLIISDYGRYKYNHSNHKYIVEVLTNEDPEEKAHEVGNEVQLQMRNL